MAKTRSQCIPLSHRVGNFQADLALPLATHARDDEPPLEANISLLEAALQNFHNLAQYALSTGEEMVDRASNSPVDVPCDLALL